MQVSQDKGGRFGKGGADAIDGLFTVIWVNTEYITRCGSGGETDVILLGQFITGS